MLTLVASAGLTAFAIASDDSKHGSQPNLVVSGTVGLTFVNGVTDTQTYNFLASADQANKGIDNLHLDAGYFFSRQTTATSASYSVASNFAFINGRYDRNFSNQLATYASLGYRVDNPNNLSLRSIYGAGVSYDVHEGKVWKWNLSGARLISLSELLIVIVIFLP
jgi:hypothetical protein